ncbi:MAG: 50S ribosomal protein L17 [uncultured bacterium]|nr:MAG: 50S ribosomal protein L17 [uncultured bacterium]HBY73327.1 50S ribosomal protein L17 [Candidatus Kerfeldbacteria bacterium]
MRHHKSVKTLDRSHAGRQALLRSQAISLILTGHIRTTPTKARVTRSFVERLVTRAKVNTEATRRYLMTKLNHIAAVNELMKKIAPAMEKRAGGYTRMTKLGYRKGDGAEQVQLEFVN